MIGNERGPIVDLTFPHNWQAEIVAARPLILPTRHFTYPRDAEEVERGALEVLVRPMPTKPSPSAQEFLATCALGFHDPAVPTGLWSCPNPDELCAVSGGYAYIVNTADPARFTMIDFRPVLEIRSIPAQERLLFVGHHALLAWGPSGLAWKSEKLSDEGITVTAIRSGMIHGLGWSMITDKETPFTLDLESGRRV